jgi:hypothetical protein
VRVAPGVLAICPAGITVIGTKASSIMRPLGAGAGDASAGTAGWGEGFGFTTGLGVTTVMPGSWVCARSSTDPMTSAAIIPAAIKQAGLMQNTLTASPTFS